MSVLGGTQRSWPMPDQRLSAYLRVCELFKWFCSVLFFIYVMIQHHLQFQLTRKIRSSDLPGWDQHPAHRLSLSVYYHCLYITLPAVTSKRLKQCEKIITSHERSLKMIWGVHWFDAIRWSIQWRAERERKMTDDIIRPIRVMTIKQSRQYNWKKWTLDRSTYVAGQCVTRDGREHKGNEETIAECGWEESKKVHEIKENMGRWVDRGTRRSQKLLVSPTSVCSSVPWFGCFI